MRRDQILFFMRIFTMLTLWENYFRDNHHDRRSRDQWCIWREEKGVWKQNSIQGSGKLSLKEIDTQEEVKECFRYFCLTILYVNIFNLWHRSTSKSTSSAVMGLVQRFIIFWDLWKMANRLIKSAVYATNVSSQIIYHPNNLVFLYGK